MRQIVVEPSLSPSPAAQAVEIVERKGIGHPDSICDGIAEATSVALSQEYLRRCGRILHHNTDKALLIAGQVEHRFGGGRQLRPIRVLIGDRATSQHDGERFDVAAIARAAAGAWIRQHLRQVDPDRHVSIESVLAPGSPELAGIFVPSDAVLPANDTSAAVGYAPLTDTERLVLETERHLNSASFKAAFPETGEDVKVMGIRTQRRVQLTVAMPLLETLIPDEATYFARKALLTAALADFVHRQRGGLDDVAVVLNALDHPGRGLDGLYLSLLGTSAEDGDSGEVGRGNRANGIIALARPSSAEAAAGKNPVSHVGKIYGVLAHQLAAHIHRDVEGLDDVSVWLCSRIGQRIDQPAIAAVRYAAAAGVDRANIERRAAAIVDAELDVLPRFCADLAAGRYPVF